MLAYFARIEDADKTLLMIKHKYGSILTRIESWDFSGPELEWVYKPSDAKGIALAKKLEQLVIQIPLWADHYTRLRKYPISAFGNDEVLGTKFHKLEQDVPLLIATLKETVDCISQAMLCSCVLTRPPQGSESQNDPLEASILHIKDKFLLKNIDHFPAPLLSRLSSPGCNPKKPDRSTIPSSAQSSVSVESSVAPKIKRMRR